MTTNNNTIQQYNWGYINTQPKPEFILDPIALSLLSPVDNRYQEIYLILQDLHVHLQRELFNKHKSQITTLYKWYKIPNNFPT